MTAHHKVALVVGAQGVIGRNLIDHLATLDDWRIVGLSRRGGESTERVRHIAVDLLDAADTRAKLGAPIRTARPGRSLCRPTWPC